MVTPIVPSSVTFLALKPRVIARWVRREASMVATTIATKITRVATVIDVPPISNSRTSNAFMEDSFRVYSIRAQAARKASRTRFRFSAIGRNGARDNSIWIHGISAAWARVM